MFEFKFSTTRNVYSYERDELTVFDFIGMVTALYEGMLIILNFCLVSVLRIDIMMENYLLKRVFRTNEGANANAPQHLRLTYWKVMRDYIRSFCFKNAREKCLIR